MQTAVWEKLAGSCDKIHATLGMAQHAQRELEEPLQLVANGSTGIAQKAPWILM